MDATDRRICAALLRDGRATWRRVAEVIGVPERTVARRAGALFDLGQISVRAHVDPAVFGRAPPAFAQGFGLGRTVGYQRRHASKIATARRSCEDQDATDMLPNARVNDLEWR